MQFLNEYWELKSVVLSSWLGALGVSALGPGRGGVNCKFIINLIFLLFLVFLVVVELGENLKFIGEYER